MIFPNKPFYVVGQGFGLSIKERMSSQGFSMGLDPNYAKRFYQKILTESEQENINELGKNLVRNVFNLEKNSFVSTPYYFVMNEDIESTMLLQKCQIIGDSCSLGLEGMNLNRMRKWDEFTMESLIEYSPHNIDVLRQASGLLTLWNEWVITAYASTSEK